MASILVVDDDPVSREILNSILTDAGHDVSEAADGFEAVGKTQEEEFALIFLDIFMPGKEGLETIKEILEIRPGARIIAVTGGSSFTSYEPLRWAKSLGAWRTMTKPFDSVEILASIDEALA